MADKERCPECHSQCGWCSQYVWIIRGLGCCSQWPKKGKALCDLAEKERGATCATCGTPANTTSGGSLMVERRIVQRISGVENNPIDRSAEK